MEVRTINADAAHAQTPGAQTTSSHARAPNRFNRPPSRRRVPTRGRPGIGSATRASSHAAKCAIGNLGASAGGPLVPRRLFYLFAWERQDIHRPVTSTVEVPSLSLRESVPDVLRPLLDAYPSPNGPDVGQGLAQLTHRFPTRSHLSVVSLRSDVRATDGRSCVRATELGEIER